METFYRHGYLYSIGIGQKLTAECDKAIEALKENQARKNAAEIAEFDRDYWHAMRKFAYAKADESGQDLSPNSTQPHA